jgi:hypothetical protein
MTDNTTIAAILASGMLLPVSAPATDANGVIGADERTRFVTDVLHAVGLYRAVLEALAAPAKDQPAELGSNVRRIRLCEAEPADAGMQTKTGGEEGDRTGGRPALV